MTDNQNPQVSEEPEDNRPTEHKPEATHEDIVHEAPMCGETIPAADTPTPKFTPSGCTPEPPAVAANKDKQEAREINPLGSSKAGKWLENFWYHYKFHTIVAVILIFSITICMVQCFMKKTPDFYICYAGPADLRATSDTTTNIGYNLRSELAPYAKAVTGKEEVNIELVSYIIGDNIELTSYYQDNISLLQDELNTANCFIFLMDEALYNKYAFTPAERTPYMQPAASLLPEGTRSTETQYRLTADGYGIYLHTTALKTVPGFSSLPEDTILCLRIPSVFKTGKKDVQIYKNNTALIKNLLAISLPAN